MKLVGKAKHGAAAASKSRCPIVDDSVLPEKCRTIKGGVCHEDHLGMRFVLGFRQPLPGHFDGKSFLPWSFTLHREKGRKACRPYGQPKSVLDHVVRWEPDPHTVNDKRKAAIETDRIGSAVSKIHKASISLVLDYLLMGKPVHLSEDAR